MKTGWRGYIFSRQIDDQNLPQRVQNLVIRTYCQSQGISFLLSAVEYSMDSSHMMLDEICRELPTVEGIVFYSVHMLPKATQQRRAFYTKILENGCGVRFALEELSILKEEDISAIEDLMLCKSLITHVKIDPKFLENL